MTESAINALKKPEIVKKIMELKDKVLDKESLYSYKEINGDSKSKNERWNSDLAIQKTVSVCGNLGKKVKSLEIQISKDEQFNCGNCIEFSSIPDSVNDDKLEEILVEACIDINIDVSETDIKTCHRLLVRRNSANEGKRVIVKIVNRKHAESNLSKSLP